MIRLLSKGIGLQGDGLWMVLPWPDHSYLHLFLGILKQRCTPSPMPQELAAAPLEEQTALPWEESSGTGRLEGARGHWGKESTRWGIRRALFLPCLSPVWCCCFSFLWVECSSYFSTPCVDTRLQGHLAWKMPGLEVVAVPRLFHHHLGLLVNLKVILCRHCSHR